MLTKNNKKGLSAVEALQYSAVHKFHQASIALIVHNLISRDMTKEFWKCFIQFDTNEDGRIDRNELNNGLKMVDTKKD